MPTVLRLGVMDGAGAPRAARPQLSDVLFPVADQGAAPLEVALVFIAGVITCFLRLPDIALSGSLWAEDGGIYLQRALLHPGLASLFEPVAGYLTVTPRLLAMFVASLPLSSQGVAVNLAAVVIQAGVAALAYAGTSGFITQRLLRGLLALAVVAVPVGPEVLDSITNLQWFLLFGGCICLLWTPKKPLGWVVLLSVLAVTAMSSPFAVIFLAGSLGRVMVQRSRAATVLAGVVATGFALQSAVMLQAPPRTGGQKLGFDSSPPRLVAGFLRRVLGDGVLGEGRHPMHQGAPGLRAGLAVGFLLVVLAICLTTKCGFPVLARASLFGMLAVVTYLLPIAVTPTLTTKGPYAGGRYYVSPVLLIISALLCLIGAVIDVRGRRMVRFRPLAVAVSGILVTSLLWGLASSWSIGHVWGRGNSESWQVSIEKARRACVASSAMGKADIPISPGGWSIAVPCGLLRAPSS